MLNSVRSIRLIIRFIAIIITGSLIFNPVMSGYARGQNLAVQSVFDENISHNVRRDIAVIKYYMKCLSKADLLSYLLSNPGPVSSRIQRESPAEPIDICLRFASIDEPVFNSLINNNRNDLILECSINNVLYFALFTINEHMQLSDITVYTEDEFTYAAELALKTGKHLAHNRRIFKHENDIDHEEDIDIPIMISRGTGLNLIKDKSRMDPKRENLAALREHVRMMSSARRIAVVKLPDNEKYAESAAWEVLKAVRSGYAVELDLSVFIERLISDAESKVFDENLEDVFFTVSYFMEVISEKMGENFGALTGDSVDSVNDIETGLFEVLKNAFVHGNAANFNYPIFIHMPVDEHGKVREFSVFDAGASDQLPFLARIHAANARLFGHGMGVRSSSDMWDYDIRTVDSNGEHLGTEAFLKRREQVSDYIKDYYKAVELVELSMESISKFYKLLGANNVFLNQVNDFYLKDQIKFTPDNGSMLFDIGGRIVKVPVKGHVPHASNNAVHIPFSRIHDISSILVHEFSAKCGNPHDLNNELQQVFDMWMNGKVDGVNLTSRYPELANAVKTMVFTDISDIDDRDFSADKKMRKMPFDMENPEKKPKMRKVRFERFLGSAYTSGLGIEGVDVVVELHVSADGRIFIDQNPGLKFIEEGGQRKIVADPERPMEKIQVPEYLEIDPKALLKVQKVFYRMAVEELLARREEAPAAEQNRLNLASDLRRIASSTLEGMGVKESINIVNESRKKLQQIWEALRSSGKDKRGYRLTINAVGEIVDYSTEGKTPGHEYLIAFDDKGIITGVPENAHINLRRAVKAHNRSMLKPSRPEPAPEKPSISDMQTLVYGNSSDEETHKFTDEDAPGDNSLIGKWMPVSDFKFTYTDRDLERGILSFKAYRVDDPAKRTEKIKIYARRGPPDFFHGFKRSRVEGVDKALEKFLKGFRGRVFILSPNKYGINGIGTKDLLAVTRAMSFNSTALFHELAHASGVDLMPYIYGGELELSEYLKKLGGDFRYKEALRRHYAIRLFQRKYLTLSDANISVKVDGMNWAVRRLLSLGAAHQDIRRLYADSIGTNSGEEKVLRDILIRLYGGQNMDLKIGVLILSELLRYGSEDILNELDLMLQRAHEIKDCLTGVSRGVLRRQRIAVTFFKALEDPLMIKVLEQQGKKRIDTVETLPFRLTAKQLNSLKKRLKDVEISYDAIDDNSRLRFLVWNMHVAGLVDVPEEFLRRQFPLHSGFKRIVNSGTKKVLIINNISDGMGDELIRTGNVIKSLFAFDKDIQITIVTNRDFLYNGQNKKLELLPIQAAESELDLSGYDMVVNYSDWGLPESHKLRDLLHEQVKKQRPPIYLSSDKKNTLFRFSEFYLEDEDFSGRLGNPQNTYLPGLRVLAELGVKYNDGPENAKRVFLSRTNAGEGLSWWKENIGNGKAVVFNGFGGLSRDKGYRDMGKMSEVIDMTLSLLPAGVKLMIMRNGNQTEDEEKFLEMRYGRDQRVVFMPRAQFGDTLPKSIINRSEYIITVEGGIVHLAAQLNKPFTALIGENSGTPYLWFPQTSKYVFQRHVNVDFDKPDTGRLGRILAEGLVNIRTLVKLDKHEKRITADAKALVDRFYHTLIEESINTEGEKTIIAVDDNLGITSAVQGIIKELAALEDDNANNVFKKVLGNIVLVRGRGRKLAEEVNKYVDGRKGEKVNPENVMMIAGENVERFCGDLRDKATLTFVDDSRIDKHNDYYPIVELIIYTMARSLNRHGLPSYGKDRLEEIFSTLNAELPPGQELTGNVVNLTLRPARPYEYEDMQQYYMCLQKFLHAA